jgi:hypothetical protein
MEPVNQTPFALAPIVGRLNFPGYSLTLIVKGTFDLSNGEVATPAEEQLFPTGDEYFPGDDDLQGSCRYESDYALHKPRADLLLAGTCHAPGGRPATSAEVSFDVGPYGKSVRVTGDRTWEGPPFFRRPSEPEQFTEHVLSYEQSFGGEGWRTNPVGIGYAKDDSEGGTGEHLLPNIEDPDELVRSTRNRPTPAGFGPLGQTSPVRSSTARDSSTAISPKIHRRMWRRAPNGVLLGADAGVR